MDMVDRTGKSPYTDVRIDHTREEHVYGTARQMDGIRLRCRAFPGARLRPDAAGGLFDCLRDGFCSPAGKT